MLNRRNFLIRSSLATGVALSLSKAAAAQSRTRSITLSVNGFQFDALSAGPLDGELVLCLHGFPQFKESWTAVIESLGASGYHAVAVDQRGYSVGARPTSESDYAVDNLVSDVLGFATFLGSDKFHLVGHDRGGTVAWSVGADHPERLLSLTVLSTPHKNAFVTAYVTDPTQQSMSQYIPTLAAPSPSGENFMLGSGAANIYGSYGGFVPQTLANLYVQRLQVQGAMTAVLNWYRVADDFHGSQGLIVVPTLYVWGAKDAFLGKVAAVGTATYCTGRFNFVQLPTRSHWLMDEDATSIATLLKEQFISVVS